MSISTGRLADPVAPKVSDMSLKLLLRLVDGGRPFHTADQSEILHIDTLKSAGMIDADVPPVESGL